MVPQGGLKNLKTDYLVLGLLDILYKDGKARRDFEKMNCDLCSEVGEGIVVAHCTDCDQLLCDHHMVDHKKTKLTKDHELILFAQEQFDPNNSTNDHHPTPHDTISDSGGEDAPSDDNFEIRNRKRNAKKVEKTQKRERKRILRPLSDVITHLKTSQDASHRTFVEMTVHALLTLGGQGTTAQITEFIEKNYSHVLEQSTAKNWKHNVVSRLSYHDDYFIKHLAPGSASVYIWMLNEDNMFPKNKEEEHNSDDEKQEEEKKRKKVMVPPPLPPQNVGFSAPPRYGKSERTFLEMVKMALKSLGGRGTVAEITDFIEANYAEELKHKAKTWKHSVRGTLSHHNGQYFLHKGSEWILNEGYNKDLNNDARPKRKKKNGNKKKSGKRQKNSETDTESTDTDSDAPPDLDLVKNQLSLLAEAFDHEDEEERSNGTNSTIEEESDADKPVPSSSTPLAVVYSPQMAPTAAVEMKKEQEELHIAEVPTAEGHFVQH